MAGKTTYEHGSYIFVDLTTRRLGFHEGGRLVSTYTVGVGKPSTPTPTGIFTIREKVLNPGGAMGTRWMGLSVPGGNYGIHGTNNPSSIGGYVSNGCIRMYNHDIEELFPRVMIGTEVKISAGSAQAAAGHFQGAKQGGQQVHTVQAGESLWEIAQKYGRNLEAIVQANQLADPDVIYPGQTIIIPGYGPTVYQDAGEGQK